MRFIIAGTFIVLGLAGGGYFLSKAVQPQTLQDATVLPDSRALPPFELLDDRGQPFGNQRLAGNWTLLFFGFTHCPDICPATLQQLSIARQRLAENGVEPLPEIVLISVDPERDTADVLADYVHIFGDHVTGVSGEFDELQKLTSDLGIHFQRANTSDTSYVVDHSTAVLLTNPAAELSALFSAPHSVDAFVNDLAILISRK